MTLIRDPIYQCFSKGFRGALAKASNLGIKPQKAPTSAETVEDVAVSKPADSVDDRVTIRVIGSINLLTKCP